MAFTIEAACTCDRGKIRPKNEDNFLFDGRCLDCRQNEGFDFPVSAVGPVDGRSWFAVFDGVGGERCGEIASLTAAQTLRDLPQTPAFDDDYEEQINTICLALSEALVRTADSMQVKRICTTMAGLFFKESFGYVCNIGDSKIFLLREGELRQISVDHVMRGWRDPRRKPPITQCLGIRPDDFIIEPAISRIALQDGDCFLLCTDGLTDMVSTEEIAGMISSAASVVRCAAELNACAQDKGGRDNITLILCRVAENAELICVPAAEGDQMRGDSHEL